eukprot:1146744-Prorocentrum_minimum.AAC.1
MFTEAQAGAVLARPGAGAGGGMLPGDRHRLLRRTRAWGGHGRPSLPVLPPWRQGGELAAPGQRARSVPGGALAGAGAHRRAGRRGRAAADDDDQGGPRGAARGVRAPPPCAASMVLSVTVTVAVTVIVTVTVTVTVTD